MIRSVQDLPSSVQEVVRRAKAAYGKVFLVAGDGEVFALIRPLTKQEADLLELETDEMRQQDDLLSKSLLHPSLSDLDDWEAGHVDMVLNAIVQISGWSMQGMVEGMVEANEHRESMYGAMVSFICSAFQSLSPRDVDKMTQQEMLKHLSMAQDIHGQGFDFQRHLDPEGWAKKKQQQMRRLPGGRQAPPPAEAGMEPPPRSADDILADPNAVNFNSDPGAIRRAIREQNKALRG